MTLNPIESSPLQPLVSIILYNFNYGRYLRQCFDSVFGQTYKNIEICFSDNASTDGSWDIALEYARRYPGVITLTCNRRNFGSDANFANCRMNVRGKYMVILCSDDALAPEFVERCVSVLEANDSCGLAMVHRAIMDDKSEVTYEAPFYNRSCVIPGAEQTAVYMMAAVNPSISQIMYNTLRTHEKSLPGGIGARWYGNRLLDFNMCCDYDMAYIKEPLLLHRVHGANDSSRAAKSLLEVIGPFLLQHQFAEIADARQLHSTTVRLPQAIEKLGRLCIRYCVRFLLGGDDYTARRYFHLAAAIHPELMDDPLHRQLQAFWSASGEGRTRILNVLADTADLTDRTCSYDPPVGSRSLERALEGADSKALV